MKATRIISAALLVLAIGAVSCSTSKKATKEYGKEIEMTESQKMAYESPSTRAWGDAVGSGLSQTTAYAEGQARAKMARALSSAITSATKESNLSWEQSVSDGRRSAGVKDEGGKSVSTTMQIAQQSIAGAAVIHTDQYLQSDGQYHVFVCLEYQGDSASKASDITNSIKQQVSDEDRAKMEAEFEKFEKAVKEELEGISMEEAGE